MCVSFILWEGHRGQLQVRGRLKRRDTLSQNRLLVQCRCPRWKTIGPHFRGGTTLIQLGVDDSKACKIVRLRVNDDDKTTKMRFSISIPCLGRRSPLKFALYTKVVKVAQKESTVRIWGSLMFTEVRCPNQKRGAFVNPLIRIRYWTCESHWSPRGSPCQKLPQ